MPPLAVSARDRSEFEEALDFRALSRPRLVDVWMKHRSLSRDVPTAQQVGRPMSSRRVCSEERGLPAALQDYWSLTPLLFEAKTGYQSRVPERIRKSRSTRFFRPLLYRLSYLGGSLILLGNATVNRMVQRAMVLRTKCVFVRHRVRLRAASR